ncbi:Killer protein [[Haemophilus] felis]|uniref:Killer protein n=1 Tax=[Haemophilus] felis TaxID=123822 RepID=A0A1T0B971_9PAST|nr:Killer protein [[Haemophilus] felis]NBI40409.1 Killer protein [[Haemophilus] felis]OOS06512.1 Killer protein [[Haemophilus] felis]
MIISFKHKGLKAFFETGSTAGIQAKHINKLRLQLETLHRAENVEAMDVPGWHLHPLKGDLANHCSVKVNANWRLTFKFENGDAEIVNYQDYH